MNGVATPIPAQGELLYTTDSKKLFIGDGTTIGGTSAGYFGSVAVAGQDTVNSTGISELLTIIAGDNITITTDSGTNSVTINAAAQFDEINNGSINIIQNNILGLNSNENIVIDPSGTGKVVIVGALDVSGTITGNVSGNLTGTVTGNVSGNAGSVTNGVYTTGSYSDPTWISSLAGSKISGNISGNATTVTNGVYTTDVASVTNTMLANSAITIGSDAVSLGGSITALTGLTSVTSSTLTGNLVGNVTGDVVGNVTGSLNSGSIRLFQNNIVTLNSNESILINPNGSGIVDIAAGVNSTGLTIYGSGVGGASGTGNIVVATSSAAALPLNILEVHSTAALTGGVSFARSRGNLLSQQTVQSGDEIQRLVFSGYDGSGFRASSGISASILGTVGSNIVPGKLDFFVTDSAGAITVKLDITGTKVSSLVPFKLQSYADATARDAYFTGFGISPEAGMMVFLTGTSKFSGYNGATWDDLN